MTQKGLTLIELLVGLVLMGIVATLAVPAFGGLMDSQRRYNATQQLASHLRMARSEAVIRGQVVLIEPLANDWSAGWRVFVDANRNRQRDENELLLAEYAGNPSVRIVGNRKVANGSGFNPQGQPVQGSNGTLAVCRQEQRMSQHQVVIAVTGRVTIRRDGFASEPCA